MIRRDLDATAAALHRLRDPRVKRDLLYKPKRAENGMVFNFPLQFHLTNCCNLRCVHCYQEEYGGKELTTDEAMFIFDRYFQFIRNQHVAGSIALTGGEPFCRKHIYELLEYLYEHYFQRGYPFDVPILTNGTLITESILDSLDRWRYMLGPIQVSLDGATAAVHDRIRGHGSFQAAVESVRKMRIRGFSVALHMVISRLNMHEAVPLLQLGHELRVGRVTISRLVPIGHSGGGLAAMMLTPEELRDTWHKLNQEAEYLIDEGVMGRSRTALARQRCDLWHLVDPEYAVESWRRPDTPVFLLMGQRCPIGISSLTIMPDGTVYPCRRLPIPLGNILQQSFAEIWFGSELLWQFRDRARFMKGKCLRCRFLTDDRYSFLCSGGSPCISYGLYGEVHRPDPQCWYNPTKEG